MNISQYNSLMKYSSERGDIKREYLPEIINYGYLPKYEKRFLEYSVDQSFRGEYRSC